MHFNTLLTPSRERRSDPPGMGLETEFDGSSRITKLYTNIIHYNRSSCSVSLVRAKRLLHTYIKNARGGMAPVISSVIYFVFYDCTTTFHFQSNPK